MVEEAGGTEAPEEYGAGGGAEPPAVAEGDAPSATTAEGEVAPPPAE